MMKICRFRRGQRDPSTGWLIDSATILDLAAAGITRLEDLLERDDPVAKVKSLNPASLERVPLSEATLLAPVDRQEIWAAGVTYLRSKKARMDESEFSANAYDRVYEAQRPELFFKSLPEKAVGPGQEVGIRRDATWSVPEPELALVISSRGKIVGCTIGNDMSSRDIEGENLLYLPQAKTYRNSCALGPVIVLGADEPAAREWTIGVTIERDGLEVFKGETSVNQIKRGFEELTGFLFRSQRFPHGAILLTGTGVVPPDGFTLREDDWIEIEVTGIGRLRNRVALV